MTTQNKLNTLLVLTLAALLSACGTQSDSGSTDSSSRAVANTSSAISLAACNQGTSTNGNMKMNIEALYENSVVRTDLMRVKFVSMNSSFSNGSNYIQMWRWQVNTNGQTYVDPTPVKFRLESISSGTALTGYMASLKWSDVSTIASNLGASTPAQFFNLVRMTVDIRDTTGEFDVLKVAYYDSSSNASVDQLDILMPLFALSPTDYATQPDGSARPAILMNLHPFKSMSGSTTAQLTSLVNGYCF